MAAWNTTSFYTDIAAGKISAPQIAAEMADPFKADAVFRCSPGFDCRFDHTARQWVGPEAGLMAAHCAAFAQIDMAARAARQSALLDRALASTAAFDTMDSSSKGSTGQAWGQE